MIALDTSALAAILFEEDDAPQFLRIMMEGDVVVGAPTLFEFKLVASKRRGSGVMPAIDLIMGSAGVEVVPWTERHIAAAIDAFHRFGGRPARLNYGDCMAYAVAKVARCPLLYKGGDFALTDIATAR